MLTWKVFLILFLSFITSYLFANTVERALQTRGMAPEKIKIIKFISLLGMFVFLFLIGTL